MSVLNFLKPPGSSACQKPNFLVAGQAPGALTGIAVTAPGPWSLNRRTRYMVAAPGPSRSMAADMAGRRGPPAPMAVNLNVTLFKRGYALQAVLLPPLTSVDGASSVRLMETFHTTLSPDSARRVGRWQLNRSAVQQCALTARASIIHARVMSALPKRAGTASHERENITA
jgi:hypothetical protein